MKRAGTRNMCFFYLALGIISYNQCVMHARKSDPELLQFLAGSDHGIFSRVVFLNLYKLRTTNESCKKQTQI